MYRALTILLALMLASPLLTANPMQPDPVNSPPAPEPVVDEPVRPKAPALPQLEGIVIMGPLRKAIFNGAREVRVGERINGYQLIDVSASSVTLQRGNQTRILTLTTPGDFTMSPATEE